MNNLSYLLVVGLTVLLFLHMILTPMIRPDREARAQDFSQSFGEFQSSAPEKETNDDGS